MASSKNEAECSTGQHAASILGYSDSECTPMDVDELQLAGTSSGGVHKTNKETATNTQSQDESEGTERSAGECEELCIIPDTERVLTQAEKDAAALVTPVRDASVVVEIGVGTTVEPSFEKYVLSNCTEETINACEQCCLPRKSKFSIVHEGEKLFICDDNCLMSYKSLLGDKISDLIDKTAEEDGAAGGSASKAMFCRTCMNCNKEIVDGDPSLLSWETLEFCNDLCLAKYQKDTGSACAKCQKGVPENCMGKYCVRFGYNIRQFCSSTCLEQYKMGLKVCSYCQKEMSEEGFLAPVTDKTLFKDFCSQECLDKYNALSISSETPRVDGACSVCTKDKSAIAFEQNNKKSQFCGEPCFVAYKFVNNISAVKCGMCHKFFDNASITEFTIYYDDALRHFCSKGCQNVYIIANRRIVPCSWCKVKKYNFDMIKQRNVCGKSAISTCSLNCLNHIISNNGSTTWTNCNECHKSKQPLYHITMSDNSIVNFCSYSCVIAFQNKYPKSSTTIDEPVPISGPKRFLTQAVEPEAPTIPIITNVQSLANLNGASSPYNKTRSKQNGALGQTKQPSQPIIQTKIRQQIIIRPPPPVPQRNVGTMCKVTKSSKGCGESVTTVDQATQTDEIKPRTALIPFPVPIYVPVPVLMYSQPYPVPFPFPLPVPVPIFVPTTRNSAKGIMKEIKKIQAKMPANPLEAEILMMADLVAGDKTEDLTDSEVEGDDHAEPIEESVITPEPPEANTSFGEEVLQIAIKMAAELDDAPVDLEGALTVNTVTAPVKSETSDPVVTHSEPMQVERRSTRGRGRGRGRRSTTSTPTAATRRSAPHQTMIGLDEPQPRASSETLDKPDANMALKYTFGVNAWKQWVATKNTELEHTGGRQKLFKPEILQLTADELNYSLCLFVKEVRKPNGQEYAPDTIFYLCLGIQQYLYENNRIDNIFCDTYYEKFTDCLDEVAKKFSVLYNDSHYIITRVEEEHLWESKQLGAHSPHVLLSTLMFFNTKHFNLTSVEDHMQLSFSHIMKHWKRNPTHTGPQKSGGSRNVLLRFYPPQNATPGGTPRKRKVYEQQENEDNPLRCPVKLYEFYLSKCPESVKTRNDVFYLLPERSCVPDSPVWYSTSALPRDALEKMLHRVKMVKEINVALLTT